MEYKKIYLEPNSRLIFMKCGVHLLSGSPASVTFTSKDEDIDNGGLETSSHSIW